MNTWTSKSVKNLGLVRTFYWFTCYSFICYEPRLLSSLRNRLSNTYNFVHVYRRSDKWGYCCFTFLPWPRECSSLHFWYQQGPWKQQSGFNNGAKWLQQTFNLVDESFSRLRWSLKPSLFTEQCAYKIFSWEVEMGAWLLFLCNISKALS